MDHFFNCTWKSLPIALQGFEQLVCLGLGNFAQGNNATHQIASKFQLLFLVALNKRVPSEALVFDPVLTQSEKAVLDGLHFKTSETNTEGQYNFKGRLTLYFLPHCPKQLTNNILWANWDDLTSIVLIGNSIKNTVLTLPASQLSTLGYLKEASELAEELSLENNFEHQDIFNNLSLHWFKPGHQKKTCKSPDPPSYSQDDLEFIKNG